MSCIFKNITRSKLYIFKYTEHKNTSSCDSKIKFYLFPIYFYIEKEQLEVDEFEDEDKFLKDEGTSVLNFLFQISRKFYYLKI